MSKYMLRIIYVLSALLFYVTVTNAQPSYHIVDLGANNDGGSINAAGQVAGQNATHAFRAIPSGFTVNINDLGTLGGTHSYGAGINGSGQVTGSSDISGNLVQHAYRTTSTGTIPGTDLGTLGGSGSEGLSINTLGQVTGDSQISGNTASHAFRTSASGSIPGTDIGTLGGANSYGTSINSSGQVAGYSQITNSTAEHAFRTTSSGSVTGTDLGTFGGTYSIAYGINDSGQVTGYSFFPGNSIYHAYATVPNGLITSTTDLGTLGGQNSLGFGINSSGVIVGQASIANGNSVAFVYTTQMYNLDTLLVNGTGWALNEATSIDDSGMITGDGTLNGVDHGFLLIPVPESQNPLAMTVLFLIMAVMLYGAVTTRSLRTFMTMR